MELTLSRCLARLLNLPRSDLFLLLLLIFTGQSKKVDVDNVFLPGFLDSPVYMVQPPGFVDPEKPAHVYKCFLLIITRGNLQKLRRRLQVIEKK